MHRDVTRQRDLEGRHDAHELAVGERQPDLTMLRELREMRYLWSEPLRMSNAALVAALGEEPHTPIDAAIDTTLHGLGCLPAQR